MFSFIVRVLLCLTVFGLPASLHAAETVRVLAALAPPFIISEQSGYTITLLKKIEEQTDLTFNITVLPSFTRAWKLTASGQADLVLHTALEQESSDFDAQMIQSNWHLPVQPAVFYKDPAYFARFLKATDGTEDKDLTVGIPYGNIHYGVQNLKLPNSTFQEAAMDSLVKMLDLGRVDVVWCMKLNVSQALLRNNIEGVYSSPYPEGQSIRLGAGFANTKQGWRLKRKLDKVVGSLDLRRLLPEVYLYSEPPE